MAVCHVAVFVAAPAEDAALHDHIGLGIGRCLHRGSLLVKLAALVVAVGESHDTALHQEVILGDVAGQRVAQAVLAWPQFLPTPFQTVVATVSMAFLPHLLRPHLRQHGWLGDEVVRLPRPRGGENGTRRVALVWVFWHKAEAVASTALLLGAGQKVADALLGEVITLIDILLQQVFQTAFQFHFLWEVVRLTLAVDAHHEHSVAVLRHTVVLGVEASPVVAVAKQLQHLAPRLEGVEELVADQRGDVLKEEVLGFQHTYGTLALPQQAAACAAALGSALLLASLREILTR